MQIVPNLIDGQQDDVTFEAPTAEEQEENRKYIESNPHPFVSKEDKELFIQTGDYSLLHDQI